MSVPRQISSVAASGPAREGSTEGIAVCAPCCHIDRRGEGGRHVDGWASEMEEEGGKEGPFSLALTYEQPKHGAITLRETGRGGWGGEGNTSHTRYSRYLELESATMTISTAWQVPPLAKRTATDQIFPKQARREKSDRIFKSRRLRPSLRDQKQQYKTGGGGGATTWGLFFFSSSYFGFTLRFPRKRRKRGKSEDDDDVIFSFQENLVGCCLWQCWYTRRRIGPPPPPPPPFFNLPLLLATVLFFSGETRAERKRFTHFKFS